MFEDVKKSDQNMMQGDPGKAVDPLNEVDPTPDLKSALQGGKLQPASSTPAGQPDQGQMPPVPTQPAGTRVGPPNPLTSLAQIEEWGSKRKRGGGLKLALIFAVLVVLAAGGVFAYYALFIAPNAGLPTTEPTDNQNTNQNTPDANQPNSNEITNQPANTNAPTTSLIDTDGDGLTDLEEQTAGTNPLLTDTDSDNLSDKDEIQVYKTDPLNSDTDNDGLPDRDEVFVWKTNPANADSDGDTYLDGAEIDHGYDPNGPGKLAPQPTETPQS